MKYEEHRHDRTLEPCERLDPMREAPPQFHELLERKGFSFQTGSDYYCFAKDQDSEYDPIERRLICVYKSGTWDGKPVSGHPMSPAPS